MDIVALIAGAVPIVSFVAIAELISVLNYRRELVGILYRQYYIEKYGENKVNAVIGLWNRRAAEINNNACAAVVAVG